MATLADLQALQQRQQLAQIMAMQRPMGNNQGARAASGIGALVNALAAKNLGGKAQAMQNEIQQGDQATLAGLLSTGVNKPGANLAEIAQIQDPQMRELALAMATKKPDSPYAPISGVGVFNKHTGEITTGPQFKPPRTPAEEIRDAADKAAAVEGAKREVTGEITLTPAEEAVDKAFAKDFNDLIAQGGAADVQKSLGQLKEARQILSSVDTASGPMVGLLPKFARDIVMPEGTNAQDLIEEVVQRNLRLVLGAQFTEKEGQRLIERAFNPRQEEQVNITRLDRLMGQIESALDAKLAAAEYYQQNGTLKGFDGATQFTIEDFSEPEETAEVLSDEELKKELGL